MVGLTVKLASLIAVGFLAIGSARADTVEIGHLETADDPGGGLNWLYLVCDRSPSVMKCDTFTTLIKNKSEAENRNEEVAKRAEEFLKDPEGMKASDCAGYEKMFAQVNAIQVANPDDMVTGLNGKKVKGWMVNDSKAFIGALVGYCRKRSPETTRQMAEVEFRKNSRTCRIVHFAGKTTFNLDRNTGKWVSNEGPTGPCGVINIGTLEHDKNVPGVQASDTIWSFTDRRVYTNPSGTVFGTSCGAFNDYTMRYTWRTADRPLGCDYITYGQ